MDSRLFDALISLTPTTGWRVDAICSQCAVEDNQDLSDQILLACDGSSNKLIKLFLNALNSQCIQQVEMLSGDSAPKGITHKMQRLLEARYRFMSKHPEVFEGLFSHVWKVENAPLNKEIIHSSADDFWRACGDRSTDTNYYSKRMLLGSVIGATTLSWYQGCRSDEALSVEIATHLKRVLSLGQFKSSLTNAAAPYIHSVRNFVASFVKK